MPQNKSTDRFVVLVSLLVAMLLRIVPLPKEWFVFNPDWVLLFMIYWAIAIPERVGVWHAWFSGLLCDVLTGRLMGQHALAYSIIVFVCVKLHLRLRSYALYYQAVAVLPLLLVSQLVVLLTQNIKAASAVDVVYWMPSLMGALIWPVIFKSLRLVRRHYKIT
ncbi:MAG: rod shape-determining protein MreD [Candidatus Methylumidiphilus sp.]